MFRCAQHDGGVDCRARLGGRVVLVIMPRMVTGSASSSSPSGAPGEREGDSLGFDPRPWPLVVGMLLALLGVFFALRPSGDGGTSARRAGIVAPALAEGRRLLSRGLRWGFRRVGRRICGRRG